MATPRPETEALTTRLVTACSDAARPRTCDLVETDPGGVGVATVTFTSENAAHITLRDESGNVTSRDVAFREEDRDADRWQAIGLLVASLAESAAPLEEEPRRRIPQQRVLWLSLAADVGDGVAPGPPRFGAAARLAFRPRGFWGFVSAGAGYASSARTASAIRPSWLPLSLGAGAVVEFESTRLALRPRLDLVLERQRAAVSSDVLEESDAAAVSGARWVPGAIATFELVVPEGAPVSVFFGGTARFMDGSTGLRLRGERVSSFPAHSYGMTFGVDLSLDALFGLSRD